MSVVGFDFGNENCVITVAKGRGIQVLQNEIGKRSTPALVSIKDKQRFLGAAATAQLSSNFKNTMTNIKRFVGLNASDPSLESEKAFISYKLCTLADGTVGFQMQYDGKKVEFSPVQVVAMLLNKLKETTATAFGGQRVSDCVIGVPACWPEHRRRALLDAAQISGLNVLRLMNETTAIALNYGILRPEILPATVPMKVMFFDMGHSQTTATIVEFVKGSLRVVSMATDESLGGRTFDLLLINHFKEYVKNQYKMDVTGNVKSMFKLGKECNRIKTVLSANLEVQMNIEYLMNDTDVRGSIKRPEFEALINNAGIEARIKAVIDKALSQVNTSASDLHSVEIVGGAVRVPFVQQLLSGVLGKELSKTCDGDESVSRGCALMCAMLSPNFRVRDFQVKDITPYQVDMTYGQAESQVLFMDRNEAPFENLVSFEDMNGPFVIDAAYSNPPAGAESKVGQWKIKGMPEGKENAKIKVRLEMNLHGVVECTGAHIIEDVEYYEEIPEPVVETADAKEAKAAEEKPAETTEMEDDEKPQQAAAEEPKADGAMEDQTPPMKRIKKTKQQRTDLEVETLFRQSIDQKTFQQYHEVECQMGATDLAIRKTAEARNTLEAYVLEMRNRVQDENDLLKFFPEEVRNKFVSDMDAMEDWLYDEGEDAQLSEYKRRKTELETVGNAGETRKFESENRPAAVAALNTRVNNLNAFVSTTDEKYAHIGAEKRAEVKAAVVEVEAFLKNLASQEPLPLDVTPAITVSDLEKRGSDLYKKCQPIVETPKPAPPKEEKAAEPKANAAEEENTKNGEEAGAAPEAASDAAASDAPAMEDDL